MNEAALADAGNADEGDELRCSRRARSEEGVAQEAELLLAANELCAGVVGDVDAEARACSGCLPDGDRLDLSLRVDGRRLCVLDRLTRGPVGRFVSQDPVDRRSGLQARSRVDDVA